jgi:hypothetical protein
MLSLPAAGGTSPRISRLKAAQVGRTERACGGPLVNRSPRAPGTGILTPLGEQLCQQARGYLRPARMRRRPPAAPAAGAGRLQVCEDRKSVV